MKRYEVLLAVEIGGVVYEAGSEVELDLETAIEYKHALRALDEEEALSGGDK